MRHYVFFVNPTAGRGRAYQIWMQIEPMLAAHQQKTPFTYELETSGEYNTTAPYPEDTVLVAVGGDGTVHRVGQVALAAGCTMGIIPGGTGNDFASNLGIPDDPAQALTLLLTAEPRTVDVVEMNLGRTALNACGFGIDAEVVEYIETYKYLKRLGRLAYAFVVARVLMRHRPFAAEVTMNGQLHSFRNVSLLVLSNGPTFGGGMRISPQARLADGVLDVCVVNELPKPTLLRLFPLIYSGRHVYHRSVKMLTGTEVSIHFPTDLRPAELDGELADATANVTAALACGKLKVICPAN